MGYFFKSRTTFCFVAELKDRRMIPSEPSRAVLHTYALISNWIQKLNAKQHLNYHCDGRDTIEHMIFSLAFTGYECEGKSRF